MSTHLEPNDLINAQQMEVAVNGPNGAIHLILCTGIAKLDFHNHETCAFLVGPHISRRQFVGVIASGASIIVHHNGEENTSTEMVDELVIIEAVYDENACQVKVQATVSPRMASPKIAISYIVNILAELPAF